MELMEAQAFAERLRPNIEALGAMPDEALREQASAALFESPAAQEASATLRQGIGNILGKYYVSRTAEEQVVEVHGLSTLPEHIETQNELNVSCEPTEDPNFYPSKEFESNASLAGARLLTNYINLHNNTAHQVRGLGPKKAAKIHSRAEKQAERLFLIPVEGEPGRFQHMVEDPTAFAFNTTALMNLHDKGELTPAETELAKELAAKLLHSGETYVAEHADRLKETQWLARALQLYAFEMTEDPNNRGPVGHLMRGYFATADTPERAVSRMESLLEAFIDSYKDEKTLILAAQSLFLFRDDFFIHVPFIENLEAASASYHKPELVDAAHQLMQVPAMLMAANLNLNEVKAKDFLRQRRVTRGSQIKAATVKTMFEGRASLDDYRAQAERYQADIYTLNEASEQVGGLSMASDGARERYMELIGGKIGPAYESLFIKPNPLIRRYEEVIGHSLFFKELLADTILLDDTYAIDIIRQPGVSPEWARLRAEALDRFVINREPSLGTLESVLADITIVPTSTNFRFQRIPLCNYDEVIPGTILARRRTLFDDEHVPPLSDFDVRGFETKVPLPATAESTARIEQEKTRFVPKRGIEVVINDKLVKESGLTKLVFRSAGPNRLIAQATIHNHERTFQIKDNQFFDKRGNLLDPTQTVQSAQFAAYCMEALAEWMCRPAVETSEGTIEEGKDGPIKGGYFAYLPVRQSDGRKYQRQDEQWYLCAEERGLDLDTESVRRSFLDPMGKMRNSTYVREHPDDGPHLAPLKIYL